MKKATLILGGIAVLALMAMPVWAGMSPIADSDLAGISGKASNQYLFSGTSNTSQILTSDNSANIQVGWYQWNDDHSADVSDHKGANDDDSVGRCGDLELGDDDGNFKWHHCTNALRRLCKRRLLNRVPRKQPPPRKGRDGRQRG